MELNQCINFLLTKAQQTVLQYFRARLAVFDITPVQYGILNCLWSEESQTPTQIAQKLCLDGSTITGILDRMEAKGLLVRTPDPEDRRAIRVVLTERGLQLMEPLNEVISSTNKDVLKIFTEEEQALLKNFLERISQNKFAPPSSSHIHNHVHNNNRNSSRNSI